MFCQEVEVPYFVSYFTKWVLENCHTQTKECKDIDNLPDFLGDRTKCIKRSSDNVNNINTSHIWEETVQLPSPSPDKIIEILKAPGLHPL